MTSQSSTSDKIVPENHLKWSLEVGYTGIFSGYRDVSTPEFLYCNVYVPFKILSLELSEKVISDIYRLGYFLYPEGSEYGGLFFGVLVLLSVIVSNIYLV